MTVQQYNLMTGDWVGLGYIINDLATRVIGQIVAPGSSPSFAGATVDLLTMDAAIPTAIDIGGLYTGSQITLTGTSVTDHALEIDGVYGAALIYTHTSSATADTMLWGDMASTAISGDFNGLRPRLTCNAASGGLNARAVYGEVIVGASKYAALTQGLLAHVSYAAGSCHITDIHALGVHISQGASLTATNLYGIIVTVQTRGDETISGNDYMMRLDNEAVGGNGRQMDAAIQIVNTNISGGIKGYGYGIDFSGGTFATAEIRFSNGETIDNLIDGQLDITGDLVVSGTVTAGQLASTDDITAADSFFASLGLVGSPSYSFTDDTDTGMYADSTGLQFSAGGLQVLSLLSITQEAIFQGAITGTSLTDGTATITGGLGTFGGITIFNPTPILVLKDSTYAGDTSLGFMEWRDKNNTRLGFFGNSSSGNDDLSWKNESSGGHIKIETTGAGEFQIFANTVLNGTLGAGAITGTSFIIGANTLTTTEWAFLDGLDQALKTSDSPTFAGLEANGGNIDIKGDTGSGFGYSLYIYDEDASHKMRLYQDGATGIIRNDGAVNFFADNYHISFTSLLDYVAFDAKKHIYFTSGQNFLFRDRDASDVVRATLQSSTGWLALGTASAPTVALDVTGEAVINDKAKITSIGGYAVKLTNKTGGNTVVGQLVIASTGTTDAFATAGASSDAVIGIVLDAGIADASEAWIVVAGIVDVLIDGGGSTIGDRMISSATAGSADVWNTGGAVATHFLEIGHCIETRVGAGLARCVLHFN